MVDITKCKGDSCPRKEDCYRFTAEADTWQSWFVVPPFDGDKCDMFWGESSENIINVIENILSENNK